MRAWLSVLLLAFVSDGCSITTTYGHEPVLVPGEEHTYTFTIHYNQYATDSDVEAAAMVEIEKLKARHGYGECEHTRFGKMSFRLYEIECGKRCS